MGYKRKHRPWISSIYIRKTIRFPNSTAWRLTDILAEKAIIPEEEDRSSEEEDRPPEEEDRLPEEEDRPPEEEDRLPEEEDELPEEEDELPEEEDELLEEEDELSEATAIFNCMQIDGPQLGQAVIRVRMQ